MGRAGARVRESLGSLARSVTRTVHLPAVGLALLSAVVFMVPQWTEICGQSRLHIAGRGLQAVEARQAESARAERFQRTETARNMALALAQSFKPATREVAGANTPSLVKPSPKLAHSRAVTRTTKTPARTSSSPDVVSRSKALLKRKS
jgi:hypothetical protein